METTRIQSHQSAVPGYSAGTGTPSFTEPALVGVRLVCLSSSRDKSPLSQCQRYPFSARFDLEAEEEKITSLKIVPQIIARSQGEVVYGDEVRNLRLLKSYPA
ncbi:hypothetical protein RRG08_022155 [Elysia crispata]|uniref:Uncharacterized protein n=1 Tax=Elysia crispata TaxID=231223 RepID=A0AAE1DYW9_9GAST|nr:hypothetical protein RRG08_022155 [Elysia crispata]